MKLKVPLIK